MPVQAGAPFGLLDRHWRWWMTLFWLGFSAWLVFDRWGLIQGFSLGDTDDNMRMMQVRGLLEGQGWYDLQQHRLAGSNIHWSRLVDLPIAGLKLLFTPLFGGRTAETIAITVAPVLPMLVAMSAVALMARRLISPYAYLLAITLLACSGSVVGMWVPLAARSSWLAARLPRLGRRRFDRSQAAARRPHARRRDRLVAGHRAGDAALSRRRRRNRRPDVDPRRRAAAALRLRRHPGRRLRLRLPRLRVGGEPPADVRCAFPGLALRHGRGGRSRGAARLGLAERLAGTAGRRRLGGVVIAGAFAWTWPHCLGRLEQSSPELERLWLSKVREAMPIWRHGWDATVATLTLPIAGLIGGLAMLHVTHRERDQGGLHPAGRRSPC